MKHKDTRSTLISRITDQGDEAAWNEFSQQYRGYLEVILSRTHLETQEIEDCLQNTLLRIWELMPKFDYDPQKGRFRSWIAQIAVNTARSYLHHESKQTTAKQNIYDLSQQDLENTLEDDWKVFISQKAWANISEDLNEAMRETFELYLQGLNSREISEKVGISEAVARVYKQRIGYKLKYEIQRLDQELG